MTRGTLRGGLLLAASVGFAGCASQLRAVAPAPPGTAAEEPVVARFATGVVTAAELEQRATGPLLAPRQRVFEVQTAILEGMIFDRLVEEAARAAGVDPRAFVEAEVDRDLQPPDESRVAELLAQFRAQLPADDAEARRQVVAFLQDEARKQRFDALKERLFAAAGVELFLEPPRAPVPVRPDNPVRGPADAPVTIVEFSDFQCPYCRQVQAALRDILARYRDSVRLVFKHFPSASHRDARAASIAATCAAAEGEFWRFHDLLFQHEGELGPGELLRLAHEAGLDVARFAACQDSPTAAATVEADLREGIALGVDATPRFFMNGRILEGVQSADGFAAVIDDELRRHASAR